MVMYYVWAQTKLKVAFSIVFLHVLHFLSDMISRNGDEAMRSYYVYLGKCVQSFLPRNFHMNPGVAAKELLVNFRSS